MLHCSHSLVDFLSSFIIVLGTAHCANMYPSSPDDSPELVEARQKIRAIISEWLESPDKV